MCSFDNSIYRYQLEILVNLRMGHWQMENIGIPDIGKKVNIEHRQSLKFTSVALIFCSSSSAADSGGGEQQEDMCRRYPWKQTSSWTDSRQTPSKTLAHWPSSRTDFTHFARAEHFVLDVAAAKLFLQRGTSCCIHHFLPHLLVPSRTGG